LLQRIRIKEAAGGGKLEKVVTTLIKNEMRWVVNSASAESGPHMMEKHEGDTASQEVTAIISVW